MDDFKHAISLHKAKQIETKKPFVHFRVETQNIANI